MPDFWEQQMMDRCIMLYFKARRSEEEKLPKQEVQDIINYTKFLLEQQSQDSTS